MAPRIRLQVPRSPHRSQRQFLSLAFTRMAFKLPTLTLDERDVRRPLAYVWRATAGEIDSGTVRGMAEPPKGPWLSSELAVIEEVKLEAVRTAASFKSSGTKAGKSSSTVFTWSFIWMHGVDLQDTLLLSHARPPSAGHLSRRFRLFRLALNRPT